MQIQKLILRDQIREHLQNEILKGNIRHEDKLSLVDISKELSVSVTPIREALGQLQQAGIVEVVPNRGFFIPKIQLSTAREIYPIIGDLESLAIRQSRSIADLGDRLSKIEDKLSKANTQTTIVRLDNDFHRILISNCENATLLRMIDDLKLKVIHYETAYMSAGEFNKKSRIAHRQILNAVTSDNLQKTADLVSGHWEDSRLFVEEFLKSHEK